jgi:hypothetical protein
MLQGINQTWKTGGNGYSKLEERALKLATLCMHNKMVPTVYRPSESNSIQNHILSKSVNINCYGPASRPMNTKLLYLYLYLQ